jgi:predicted ArsR family transcriptional regulator
MAFIDLFGESRSAILQLLLAKELTAKEMASELDLSETAVRAQLDALEGHGFISSKTKRLKERGRPRRMYSLTPAGLDAFPRRYEVLLETILDTLIKSVGEEKAAEMLTDAGRALGLRWRPKFKSGLAPMMKLHMIVRLLNEMGFVASLRFEDDKPILIRQNCIFHRTASSRHDLICERFDNALMVTLLEGLGVTLVECIHDGKGGCKNLIEYKGRPKR